jgi:hypothetical protein
MKLINTLYIALTIAVSTVAWVYTKPLITQNGTSVIYAMSIDGKNGGKPLTVKLSNDISNRQHELLSFAYEVAKADGIKNPQYLQGILMQESKACGMKNFRVAGLSNKEGDRYFGCGQIKLAAAKAVMNRYSDMWKYLESKTVEELQARLILDDKFNIRVASKYVLMMGINENPTRAITAYNVGPGAVVNVNSNTHGYTLKVKQFSKQVKNVPTVNNELQLSSNSNMTRLALIDRY